MLFQQNTHDPAFNVSGLRAGRSYVLTVYAQNGKGRSSPVTLYSFTIKEAEKHTAGSTHPVANVTRSVNERTRGTEVSP